MIEKDGILYADENSASHRIIDCKPLKGRMLLLTFENGNRRLYDTTLLTGPAFNILNDESVFNAPTIFHGFITWDNGNIDVAPETMYHDSIPYETDYTPICAENQTNYGK